MNGAIRQRWLTRLRSGKAVQCRRFLHPRPGVFDVLGLLVDLYVQDGLGRWEIRKPGRKVFTLDGVESVLPPKVRQWAGLTSEAVQFLVDLNDGGHSFSAIADWIENTIPGENHDDEPTPGTSSPMGSPAPHQTQGPEPME